MNPSENEIRARLVDERLSRLERALAELADSTYRVSNPGQIVGLGKPALASLVRDHRGGMLETADSVGAEVRA